VSGFRGTALALRPLALKANLTCWQPTLAESTVTPKTMTKTRSRAIVVKTLRAKTKTNKKPSDVSGHEKLFFSRKNVFFFLFRTCDHLTACCSTDRRRRYKMVLVSMVAKNRPTHPLQGRGQSNQYPSWSIWWDRKICSKNGVGEHRSSVQFN
jgi:hypothetical protein